MPPSCVLASLLLQDLKFLTFHIYFHLDDSELWKQYRSLSQEMMGQICDLETVEPHEIPIKVCVIFYKIELCYRGCGENKQVFLQSFNKPKCIVVGSLMVEGLLFCYFNVSDINYYARQKTLTDDLRASLITCYYLSSVALEALYCHTI